MSRLEGELSFATVGRWLAQADELTGAGTLDLSAVPRADSAGVALLLELTRRARARNQALQLIGVQPQPASLISFFDLEPVLMPAEKA